MSEDTEPAPLGAPAPLADDHLLDDFSCGAPTPDTWLKRKARANQAAGASRTYVLCRGRQVVGFYALAAGSIGHAAARARSGATCLIRSR